MGDCKNKSKPIIPRLKGREYCREKRGAGVEMTSNIFKENQGSWGGLMREEVGDEAEMDQGAIIT